MKTATSPRTAIANHCKGCTYDSQCVGNWRQQVEACAITDCELFEHRPLTGKTKRLQREHELSMLTPDQREQVEIRNENARQNMLNLHGRTTAAAVVNVSLN